jgi:hypothetical protein
MKRLPLLLCILLTAAAAHAFDTTRASLRIGVLRASQDVDVAVVRYFRAELRERGFDAFDAEVTYEEWLRDGAAAADYYAEIVGGEPTARDHGGIALAGGPVDVSLGVVSSRVAAEVRLYDGATADLLVSEELTKKTTALLPTGVGAGGRALYGWIALPFIERAQFRHVVRAAARAAAGVVAGAVK